MADFSYLTDSKKFIEGFLKIRTKEGKIVPFVLNEPQLKLYRKICELEEKGEPLRLIILKARQMGFSTLTEALIYKKTVTKKLRNSLIITHKDEATTNLFNMSKLFYEKCPEPIRPMIKNSNAKELIFENPTKNPFQKKKRPGLKSKIKCTTAGGKGVGRSDTLNYIHMSEFAFWPGDIPLTYAGLMQAVPLSSDSMVIIESTANGFNDFRKMWVDAVNGDNDFTPIFFAWFEMQEYRRPYNGEELTKEECDLKSAFNLDNEQIMWRRWCIRNNCNNDIDMFRQEYPSTADEAFLTTGDCVFKNKEDILKRKFTLEKENQIIKRGRFVYKETVLALNRIVLTDIRFAEDKDGEIVIFKDVKDGVPYVLGGDTAGEGSDNFTAQVLDNRTGEQVARLTQNIDESEYSKQIYCLGKYFNDALLAIEVNFSTYPIKMLEMLGYTHMYEREIFDSYSGKTRKSFGFRTDSLTRPLLVSQLVEYFKYNLHLCNDIETLGEALTFIKNKKGRAEAEVGEHDDLIMGLGIALMARGQQVVERKADGKGFDTSSWTEDMWEDYYNADEDEKRYLMSKWVRGK